MQSNLIWIGNSRFERAALAVPQRKRESWASAPEGGFEGENYPSAAKAGTFASSQ
jgi:hypothetical protein